MTKTHNYEKLTESWVSRIIDAKNAEVALLLYEQAMKKVVVKHDLDLEGEQAAKLSNAALASGVGEEEIEKLQSYTGMNKVLKAQGYEVKGVESENQYSGEDKRILDMLKLHRRTDENDKPVPVKFHKVIKELRPGLSFLECPGASKSSMHAWMEWNSADRNWTRITPTKLKEYILRVIELSGISAVSTLNKQTTDTLKLMETICRRKRKDIHGNEEEMTLDDIDQPNDLMMDARGRAVSLKECKGVSHREDSPMLKRLGAVYKPGAACPLWLQFMEDAYGISHATTPEEMDMARKTLAYMKRVYGSALLPHNENHLCIYKYGQQNTGKSTELDILAEIFGDDHTAKIDSAYIVHHKGMGNSVKAETLVAQMVGARLAVYGDLGANGQLRGDIIKSTTGETKSAARKLWRDAFKSLMMATQIIQGNLMLQPGRDVEGLERRFRVINPLVDNEKIMAKRDPKLKEKILGSPDERSGILNWLLEGLLDYNENGEQCPRFITVETAKYLNDYSPVVRRFLIDQVKKVKGSKVSMRELFELYKRWRAAEGENDESGFREGSLTESAFRQIVRANHIIVDKISVSKKGLQYYALDRELTGNPLVQSEALADYDADINDAATQI